MTKQALYLKWRPQTFDDVIGQQHVTRTLLNAIQTGRIRHAYLFSGPRGTGKTTTARLLAHTLGSRNLDLIEIDAASHTGVDDVRELRDKIQFMPSQGQYKVYIIDEVHRFSGSAFDALLKTLEEPPEHAIFVLATTEIDKVPDTIKSRCLQFEFRRVALREVADRLQFIAQSEGLNIDRDALELIARYGTGSVRDSISLLDQIVADPDEHITLALAQRILGTANNEAVTHLADAILRGDSVQGLHILNDAIDSGSDPRQFGQQIVEHLRYVLLAQTANANLIDASDEMRAIYTDHATLIDKQSLLKIVRSFNEAVNDQRSGWQPQLALELALLESTQERETVSPPTTVSPTSPPMQTAIPANLEALIEQIVETRLAMMPPPSNTPTQTPPPPSKTAEPEPEPPVTPGAPPVLPLSQIQAKWSEVHRAAKGSNNAILPAVLEHVQPHKVEGNLVTLAVTKAIFQEKLSTGENRSLLEFILSRLHDQQLKVKIVLRAEGDTTPTTQTSGLSNKWSTMGEELGAQVEKTEPRGDKDI